MQNTTLMNKSIELFCGTGGLALGLQNAGFQHTALYEWDKDSCDNIKATLPLVLMEYPTGMCTSRMLERYRMMG